MTFSVKIPIFLQFSIKELTINLNEINLEYIEESIESFCQSFFDSIRLIKHEMRIRLLRIYTRNETKYEKMLTTKIDVQHKHYLLIQLILNKFLFCLQNRIQFRKVQRELREMITAYRHSSIV